MTILHGGGEEPKGRSLTVMPSMPTTRLIVLYRLLAADKKSPCRYMLGSQEVLNGAKMMKEDRTQRELVIMRLQSAAAAPLCRDSRCGRSRELLLMEEVS